MTIRDLSAAVAGITGGTIVAALALGALLLVLAGCAKEPPPAPLVVAPPAPAVYARECVEKDKPYPTLPVPRDRDVSAEEMIRDRRAGKDAYQGLLAKRGVCRASLLAQDAPARAAPAKPSWP